MSYNPTPQLGQTAATFSTPVTLANENIQDLFIIGSTGATLNGNLLLTPSGNTSFDSVASATTASTAIMSYRSFYTQVIGSGGIASGNIIFEVSNDNITFNPLAVYDDALVTAVPIVAAFAVAASANRYFSGKITHRYFRIRISTAFAGGNVQALTRFSPLDYIPRVLTVAQATAGNLNMTVGSGTITTVTTVTTVAAMTSGNLGIPSLVNDVASAAIAATTTTAAFTPTFGISYELSVPVTVSSGTGQSMDIQVQESDDSGTNWFPVYDMPRIIATGIYRTPKLPLRGNRVRYVQTISGASPSFTRAINRFQSSDSVNGSLSQQIDRTIVLSASTGITPALNVQNARNIQLVVSITGGTSAPVLQLQGSDDNGSSWYSLGNVLSASTATTVQTTISATNTQLARVAVSSSGSTGISGYVLIKGF